MTWRHQCLLILEASCFLPGQVPSLCELVALPRDPLVVSLGTDALLVVFICFCVVLELQAEHTHRLCLLPPLARLLLSTGLILTYEERHLLLTP